MTGLPRLNITVACTRLTRRVRYEIIGRNWRSKYWATIPICGGTVLSVFSSKKKGHCGNCRKDVKRFPSPNHDPKNLLCAMGRKSCVSDKKKHFNRLSAYPYIKIRARTKLLVHQLQSLHLQILAKTPMLVRITNYFN